MPHEHGRNVWQAAWADALRAMSLGWDLAIPICGGALLGHYLDRRLGTGYVTTMGLLVLGIMVGVYNAGRKIQRELQLDRYRSEQESEERERSSQDSSGLPSGQP